MESSKVGKSFRKTCVRIAGRYSEIPFSMHQNWCYLSKHGPCHSGVSQADKSMNNKAEWSNSWLGMPEPSCFSLALLFSSARAKRVHVWWWRWSVALRASHRCWVVVDLPLSLYRFGAGRPIPGLSPAWDFFDTSSVPGWPTGQRPHLFPEQRSDQTAHECRVCLPVSSEGLVSDHNPAGASRMVEQSHRWDSSMKQSAVCWINSLWLCMGCRES